MKFTRAYEKQDAVIKVTVGIFSESNITMARTY